VEVVGPGGRGEDIWPVELARGSPRWRNPAGPPPITTASKAA